VEILFKDKDIVVCIKPVGMDSEAMLPDQLQQMLGGKIYTLHRLDKNVGGVMVYARTKEAAAAISEEIRNSRMIKEYCALVHGTPPETGTWEDLLFKDSRKNKVFVVKKQRAGVKAAKLEYRCLKPGEQSLVWVRLHTGRSHQIRVQFASRGYPLVGDHKYGSRAEQKEPMLFSCKLTFFHAGQQRSFEAIPQWAENTPAE